MTDKKKKLPKGCAWVVGAFGLLFLIIMIVTNADTDTDKATPAPAEQTNEDLLAGIDSVEINNNIDSLLKYFVKKRDDFQKTTFYIHKQFGEHWNNRNTLRVVVRDNGTYYMQSNYYGKDWIWHSHVIALIDNNTFDSPEISMLSNMHHTDNTAYNVWEVNDYNETGDNHLLAYIASGKDKDVRLRFAGNEKSVDATLSQSDKNAIATSLDLATNLSILNKFQSSR